MSLAMTAREIHRRRANTGLSAVKARQQAGIPGSDRERAFIRVSIQTTNVLTGLDDLSDWDEEELERGKRRDKNGGWLGVQPKVVPKALHDELVRRTMARAQTKLQESLYGAVSLLDQIIKDPDADNRDRLVAAKMVIDRVMGKDPVKVDVATRSKWEDALEGAIVSVGDIIEATAREDGEEEDVDPFSD